MADAMEAELCELAVTKEKDMEVEDWPSEGRWYIVFMPRFD